MVRLTLIKGTLGHLVAQKTIELLEEYLTSGLSKLDTKIYDLHSVKCVLMGIGDFIQSALTDSEINLRYSGTTLVCALIIKNQLYFANIGDSRAVLASKMRGRLTKSLATEDHVLDLSEERERVESCKGIVQQYTDEDGDLCGPLRVWDHELIGPGLAMSRSLGDTKAHTLGVSTKPGKKQINIF